MIYIHLSLSSLSSFLYRYPSDTTTNDQVHWRDAIAPTSDWAKTLLAKVTSQSKVGKDNQITGIQIIIHMIKSYHCKLSYILMLLYIHN